MYYTEPFPNSMEHGLLSQAARLKCNAYPIEAKKGINETVTKLWLSRCHAKWNAKKYGRKTIGMVTRPENMFEIELENIKIWNWMKLILNDFSKLKSAHEYRSHSEGKIWEAKVCYSKFFLYKRKIERTLHDDSL